MNELVGVCFECGISDDNCEELEFILDTTNRGRYWFGVDEDYTITLSCTVSDLSQVSEQERTLMIVVGLLLFSSCILLICYVYRSTLKLSKKKPFSTELIPINSGSMKARSDDEEKEDGSEEDEVIDLEANTVEKDPILEIIDNILLPAAEEGNLDVYQMLAFRRLDPNSHVVRRIFKYNEWLFTISSYHFMMFVCFIVGLLQVFGLTVTLYSVVAEYFDKNVDHSVPDDHQCEWQTEAWEESWPFKVLAFLWSIIISISVGIYVSDVRKNGIYPMLKKTKYYDEFSTMVDFTILQIGVNINLYALLVAVVGSFFLIYASEGGSDALDMILNAVALFFILEVDDLLVSSMDARAIKAGIEQFRKDYLAGKDGNHPRAVKRTNSQCCSKRIVVFCVTSGKYFRMFVQGVVGVCALFAPWAIMICW